MNKFITSTGVFLNILLISGSVVAAKWEVTPSVTVREIYSDNINLEANNEDSDFVTDVTPGITVVGEGKRLNLQFDYRMQGLAYADDSDRNTVNHRLNASADSELIEEHLFFDVSSGISQQLANSRLGASSDAISGSGNVEDVYRFSASPNWKQNLGDIASFDLRYTYDQVDTETSGNDSTGNNVDFNISNGPATNRLSWDGNYRSSDVDYGDGDQSNTEIASLIIRYRVLRHLSLNVNGTKEENEFRGDRGDVEPDDEYYGVGFTWFPSEDFSFTAAYNERKDPLPSEDKNFVSANLSWKPTVRTQIVADYGNRFFGDTYNFQFSHETRRTRSAISYSETTSNFRQQILTPTILGSLICPFGAISVSQCRVAAVGELPGPGEFSPGAVGALLPGISDNTYILEQVNASFSIKGARNTITVSVNDQQRTFVADNQEEHDFITSLSWSHDVGPNTTSEVTLRRTDREFEDNTNDEILAFSWLLSGKLSEKSTLSFQIDLTDKDSDNSTNSYEENRVTVSFNKRI
jgi:uncharacterized protein (PEP-CTERM system associated)